MTQCVFVKDVMQTELTLLKPEMYIHEARDLLAAKHISGAPVVSAEGRLIGVLSQTDLVRALENHSLDALGSESYFMGHAAWSREQWNSVRREGESKTVADVMGENLFTTTPEERISIAARKMRQYKIHRLIVTDKDRVVGVVTSFDLLRALESA